MKIIEKFTLGKSKEKLSDDMLFYNDDFVAVIDGVSTKSNFRYQEKSTGRIASEIIYKELAKAEKNISFFDLIKNINLEFEKFYKEVNFTDDKELKGIQAVGVFYSNYQKKIYLVGDCQILINNKLYSNSKLSDEILSEFRSLVSQIEIKEKSLKVDEYFKDGDYGRKLILPWILKSTIFANDANTRYGYAVFNGKEIPKQLIKEYSVQLGDEIVLASDGYPKLFNSLEKSENYLIDLLNKDSYLINEFTSTKGVDKDNLSFDDRTYIKFIV